MEDFYETSYVKTGRDGRHPRLCVTYHDAEGRRHERTRSAKPKRESALRREAEEWRALLNDEWRAQLAEEEERRRREEIERRTPMLSDYLRDHIADRAVSGVERSTLKGYRARAKLVLEPDGGLSDLRLDQITVDVCRSWLRHLVSDRELAAGTISPALTILRSALDRAVDDGIIPSNPARRVQAPKLGKEQPNALDRPSVARLEEWIGGRGGDWFTTFVAIGLYTGMREGEIAALTWDDVDMEGGVLHVRHAIGNASDGAYLKRPKSGKSRKVGIPGVLLRVLRMRRDEMLAELIGLYDGDEAPRRMPRMYVCGKVDGTWQSTQVLGNRWRKLRVQLGLRGFERDRCPFHDLRHTYITYLLNAGVPVKQIAAIVGHSSAAMTLDVYASVDPESVANTALAIGTAYNHSESGHDEPTYELPVATQ